jgi:hypothetical protein
MQAMSTVRKTHAITQSRWPEEMNKIAARTSIQRPSLIMRLKIRPGLPDLLSFPEGVLAFIFATQYLNAEDRI